MQIDNMLGKQNCEFSDFILQNNHYHRLVNMLAMTQINENEIWKIVTETRKTFLFDNTNIKCQNDETLLSDTSIKYNMDIVEEKLMMNESYSLTTNENISMDILKIAAELYTYLNICPPELFPFIIREVFTM